MLGDLLPNFKKRAGHYELAHIFFYVEKNGATLESELKNRRVETILSKNMAIGSFRKHR